VNNYFIQSLFWNTKIDAIVGVTMKIAFTMKQMGAPFIYKQFGIFEE